MAFLEETFYLFCLRLPQSVGVKNNQAHVRPLPVILLHLIKAFKVLRYTRLCFFLREVASFLLMAIFRDTMAEIYMITRAT